MCIRDRRDGTREELCRQNNVELVKVDPDGEDPLEPVDALTVSYTHLRAHETVLDIVCRLLLEKKKLQHQQHILCVSTKQTEQYSMNKLSYK